MEITELKLTPTIGGEMVSCFVGDVGHLVRDRSSGQWIFDPQPRWPFFGGDDKEAILRNIRSYLARKYGPSETEEELEGAEQAGPAA